MVRIEVETMVWSSAASSMPDINPMMITVIWRWVSPPEPLAPVWADGPAGAACAFGARAVAATCWVDINCSRRYGAIGTPREDRPGGRPAPG